MAEEISSFWGHISALRRTLIQIFAIIAAGALISLLFYQEVFALVAYPLQNSIFRNSTLESHEIKYERIYNSSSQTQFYTLPPSANAAMKLSEGVSEIEPHLYAIPSKGSLEIEHSLPHSLVVLGPLDGMFASFKISFWIGLVGASPFWMLCLLKFISPALHPREKRLILPFLTLSLVFLSLGFFFAYCITIPLANAYLMAFNKGIGVNLWTLSNYVDYTVTLLLANALAFESFVILAFLVHFGVLNADLMKQKRRHMIVAAFIIGALLTPPDILTQFLLAVPLICLYECAILYARLRAGRVHLFGH